MTVTYRKCHTQAGDVEAVLNLRQYGATGFYRIEVSGFGLTESDAARALQGSLVQASAAVSVAISDVMAGRI
jgi:hypothetical protein